VGTGTPTSKIVESPEMVKGLTVKGLWSEREGRIRGESVYVCDTDDPGPAVGTVSSVVCRVKLNVLR